MNTELNIEAGQYWKANDGSGIAKVICVDTGRTPPEYVCIAREGEKRVIGKSVASFRGLFSPVNGGAA